MIKHKSWAVFGALALLTASAAVADVVTLTSDRDNTLYENEVGNVSNGAGEHFFAGVTAEGLIRRGLVHFDVSSIPPGSTVNSVVLTLFMSRTNSGPSPVSLHRAQADWGEGASDAPGFEGSGAPAETGDATWLHTFFDNMFWSTQGGDFAASSSATTVVDQEGSYSWGTTAGMASDVEDWILDASQNFGWVVVGFELVDGKQGGSAKRFDSREVMIEGVLTPQLTIDFTLPVPVELQGFEVE